MKTKHRIKINDFVLIPWQDNLLKHIKQPDTRKVMWVEGAEGGEVMTWIQEYVE